MESPLGRTGGAHPSVTSAIVGAIVLSMALSSPAAAAAGDLDPTFGIDGRVTTNFTNREDVAYPVALQADGKIVVAGTSRFADFALARYNTDGSLDTSFDGDGKLTTDFGSDVDVAYGLVIQPDGRIVAAGTSGFREFALARYHADGSLDESFGEGGKVTTDLTLKGDFAYGVALQADGKIVAAGDAGCCGSRTRFALARYNTDGSLDTTFGGDGKVTTDFTRFPDDGLVVAIQADGKIVMAGGAGFGGPNERFALARYDTDGSLDTTFGGDGKLTTDFSPDPDVAFGLAIQADGKVVAAGASRLGGSNNPRFALARYNTDGSLDTTFDGDGKVRTDFTRGDDDAYTMAIQADGKIVAAGQAGTRNTKFALARYETDGSLDTTFGGDGRLTTDFTRRYDSVHQVVIQPDGKILAAGTAGFTKFALARYLAS